MAFDKIIKSVFGDRNERFVKSLQPTVARINDLGDRYSALDAAGLRACTADFKQRLEQGESLDDILPEAFAVVREASQRTIGLRPYDVQLVGAIVLHQGKIAEMATGEGKTLAAVLPAYLNALTGHSVYIVTVNDYLAQRDRDWMSPVYESVGLRSGAIQSSMSPPERLEAYGCDITFGTNNEFGFDYLRDNMKSRAEDQVQAVLHYAIIDEVDSILVDEARTPLIISGMPEKSSTLYYQADAVARKLEEGRDFEVKEKEHTCVLTEDGIDNAQRAAGVESFYDGDHMEWPHHLEQSLRAHHIYTVDKEYVIKDGEQGPEVVIVDEFTGRLMPGRRWSDGLHQAVEAKEGLRTREEMQTLATITFQNYFRLYDKIAGMTGTAMTEAGEFKSIYDLDVVAIPPNKPIIRNDEDDVVYRTKKEKWKAIADEIEEVHKTGAPILVGTISIEASEELAGVLGRRGIKHEVLNAKNHLREAHIITQAGSKGAVTVSTNMAGRGTDIKLGGNIDGLVAERLKLEPDADPKAVRAEIARTVELDGAAVLEAGGLYVIGTERHESRRIDNQLRGRSGRQGDPGRTRFYLSLDDDLMRIFARDWVGNLLEKLGMTEGQEIQSGMVSRGIERAQKRVESRNFEIRKNLLDYDEVMDTQRKTIYGKRQEVLEGDELKGTILEMCSEVATAIVYSRVPEKGETDVEGLLSELSTKFNTTFEADELPLDDGPEAAAEAIIARLEERYDERTEELGVERMRALEKFLLLNTIDSRWKEHLRAMDALKQGIGLRGYAQVDPKVEYKREGYDKFGLLLGAIAEEITSLLFRLQVQERDTARLDDRWGDQRARQPAAGAVARAPARAAVSAGLAAMQRGRERAADQAGKAGPVQPIVRSQGKVSRNDTCPCGSGKKYKRCCYPKYDR